MIGLSHNQPYAASPSKWPAASQAQCAVSAAANTADRRARFGLDHRPVDGHRTPAGGQARHDDVRVAQGVVGGVPIDGAVAPIEVAPIEVAPVEVALGGQALGQEEAGG
ncbi:hypothetical protein, partial [Methylobacterium aquaticum]